MNTNNAFEKLMQAAKSPGNKRKPESTRAHTSKKAKDVEAAQLSPIACTLSSQQTASSLAAHTQDHAAAVAAFRRVFSGPLSTPAKQRFQYLLVYDLEATCNRAKDLHPVEIIEFACILVNTATAEIEGSFQAYVRPTERKQLDPFCIELTGIQQHQIDAAEPLQTVLDQHHRWLEQQGLFRPGCTFVPVTWTAWDLKVALCMECRWRRIQRPDYLCSWVDLKQCFIKKYKKGGNLRTCVEAAGLTWQGRQHSGLDDAANTANLAIKLMLQGEVLAVTEVSENPALRPASATSGNNNRPGSAATGVAAALSNVQAATAAEEMPGSADDSTIARSASGNSSGRTTMQALAAAKGVVGVFDSAGRWTGRCFCSAKAHLRVTKKPGANHGRKFYSCGSWRITKQSQTCDFFMWQEDVPRGSILPT